MKNKLIVLGIVLLAGVGILIALTQKNPPKQANQAEEKKTVAELVKGMDIKNFSLTGTVTGISADSFSFYTAVVRKTAEGTRAVYETKTVKVTNKTLFEKTGSKAKVGFKDLEKDMHVTVFSSANPFDATEFLADRILIEK